MNHTKKQARTTARLVRAVMSFFMLVADILIMAGVGETIYNLLSRGTSRIGE